MSLNFTSDIVDIYSLPERCIANALSLTSPGDACRLSIVASKFRSAAQSDTVWERFLPTDYKEIISRSTDGQDLLLSFPSKKDLYLHLCDHPIIIDGGNKSFSLEKRTGKKCFMLGARDLMIVWGDTPEYWKWTSFPKSRFSEVAELLDVCWLEIRGKINVSMLSPDTTYAAHLVFTTEQGLYGFESETCEGSVGISAHESQTRSIFLDPEGATSYRPQIVPRRIAIINNRLPNIMRQPSTSDMDNDAEYPKKRDDGWDEVLLGELYVKEAGDGELVEISLLEVNSGNWKSGLIIEGIEIRPN